MKRIVINFKNGGTLTIRGVKNKVTVVNGVMKIETEHNIHLINFREILFTTCEEVK